MASLDKLIGQLGSPNADKRYDACEELRVSGESSEAVIDALERAAGDADPDVAERASAALDAEAHRAMRVRLGRLAAPVETAAAQDPLPTPGFSADFWKGVGLGMAGNLAPHYPVRAGRFISNDQPCVLWSAACIGDTRLTQG